MPAEKYVGPVRGPRLRVRRQGQGSAPSQCSAGLSRCDNVEAAMGVRSSRPVPLLCCRRCMGCKGRLKDGRVRDPGASAGGRHRDARAEVQMADGSERLAQG